MAHEKLRHAVPRADQVVSYVFEHTCNITHGFCFLVGHEHLYDVAASKQPCQKDSILTVVLLAPVGSGFVHLRDCAHHAVNT